MPRFLSSEWLDALDNAISQSPALREGSLGRKFVIQQTVTGAPDGDTSYHLRVDDGAIAVRAGEADTTDVRFVTDYPTAVAVNMGADSAQAAFMRGSLRIGGDVAELLRNADLLALVDDVFALVRAETRY